MRWWKRHGSWKPFGPNKNAAWFNVLLVIVLMAVSWAAGWLAWSHAVLVYD